MGTSFFVLFKELTLRGQPQFVALLILNVDRAWLL